MSDLCGIFSPLPKYQCLPGRYAAAIRLHWRSISVSGTIDCTICYSSRAADRDSNNVADRSRIGSRSFDWRIVFDEDLASLPQSGHLFRMVSTLQYVPAPS